MFSGRPIPVKEKLHEKAFIFFKDNRHKCDRLSNLLEIMFVNYYVLLNKPRYSRNVENNLYERKLNEG
jgi:hypothetical protein